MKKYSFGWPDENGNHVEEILTEEEIIEQYFEYWSGRMKEVNKEHLISRENCIDDFILVNWAIEIKE